MKKRTYPATRAKATPIPWDEVRVLAAQGLTATDIKRRIPTILVAGGYLIREAARRGIVIRKMTQREVAARLREARAGKPRGSTVAIDAWGRWTKWGIAELTRLWGLDMAAGKIAAKLGVTRGSVTGKAARLNLPGRPSPIGAPDGPRVFSAAEGRRKALALPKSRPPFWPGRAAPAPSILSGCQWISGEPTGDDSCKCGAPALIGLPYCAEHHAKARLKIEREVAPRKAA